MALALAGLVLGSFMREVITVNSPCMKVICAPDKFKGSLTADEAACAMQRGIELAMPDAIVDLCPIADGGEGFITTLHRARGGTLHQHNVTGPRGNPVTATWLTLPAHQNEPLTAAIEMAQASGLQLLRHEQRDPTKTTTLGTGELLHIALGQGHQRILMGIGGSATNDGGIGMALALGAKFYNQQGDEISLQSTAHIDIVIALSSIHRIDVLPVRQRFGATLIQVACDVTNPLTGPQGASHVYGPQKGATPAQVQQLDAALAHLAERVRVELGLDLASHPASGAAGGLGFGLMAFAGATLMPGIDLILDAVQFQDRVRSCDLCLTGEGKLDQQSLAGKACIGVAQAAAKEGVPTIALVGSSEVSPQQAQLAGLATYHVISGGRNEMDSMKHAATLVEESTRQVVCDFLRI